MVNKIKEQEAIGLLKEILSIASVNGKDNEGNLANFIHDYFQKQGVYSRVDKMDETHSNVIAKIEGTSEETVIWNGHLDTVPYGERSDWNHSPALPYEKSGRIYARGASDMKSGLAAMVYLIGEQKRLGRPPKKNIYFIGTCDEEKDGIGAKHVITHKQMEKAELLLVGEPTGLRLGVAQKGCLWLKLYVSGETSHGAYPKEGTNAIEYGYCVFEEFKAEIEEFEHPILGNATAQITKISGGIVPNMTPDQAELTIDVRILPGMEGKKVIQLLETICKKYDKHTKGKARFRFKILNDRKAIEMDMNSKWISVFREELRKQHIPAEEIGINYFTDASILTQTEPEIPVLLFGPGEPSMAHRPNEYVETAKYLDYITIMKHIFLD